MDETKNNTQDSDRFFSQLEGELKTRFDLLPTELQQVITSSDYQTKLFEIAKKHKLTYDKLGQLELETTMVLLGMTPPDEFKLDISEQLKLDDATLNNIVKDLNDQIFIPIRQQLMGVYSPEAVEAGEKFANDTTMTQDKAPTTAPTPVSTEPTPETKTRPSSQGGTTPVTPVTIKETAPQAALLQRDPYRELPEVKPGSGVADPVEIKKEIPKGSIDTSFLKDIAPLSTVEKTPTQAADSFINKTKNLGGLATMSMPTPQKKAVPVETNSGATLKKIQGLKDALAPESTKSPIVQKEIIETKPLLEKTLSQNPFEKPAENSSSVPTPLGASLKENPLSYREPIETTPSQQTLQKIDSLINTKKLEYFTENKPTETDTAKAPMTNTASSLAQPAIYDKAITPLAEQVSKTGFFAKMKNFFGSKKTNSSPEPQNSTVPSTAPAPLARAQEIVAKGPIDDALVNDVKIFEETPIQK